jgi:histidinol phosphatase-like enzyme
MAMTMIEKHKIDPLKSVMVGDMKTDETMAKRLGMKYVPADKFFP